MDLNVNLKITIEETPSLLTTLNTLVECLRAPLDIVGVDAEPETASQAPAAATNAASQTVTAQNHAQTAQAAQPAAPAPAAVPTAPAEHKYTLAEIQAACAPLMDAGKMAELQGIMAKYGVPSLMQIPAERYGELATDLRAIGARL